MALVGRRDFDEPWYGQEALAPAGVLDLPAAALRENGPHAVAAKVLERVARPDLAGFWVHVDADVLDSHVMPPVDSPAPGGPSVDELAALLAPLARHPRALGMELTIYDPRLDPDLACAGRLVEVLEKVLRLEQFHPSGAGPRIGTMPPDNTNSRSSSRRSTAHAFRESIRCRRSAEPILRNPRRTGPDSGKRREPTDVRPSHRQLGRSSRRPSARWRRTPAER